MGGYGALRLGAKLGPARTAGICAISPALYTSFADSAPGAFDSYDDYVQNSVLNVPVGQLTTPPATSFTLGGHDMGWWRLQLPGELTWMAT